MYNYVIVNRNLYVKLSETISSKPNVFYQISWCTQIKPTYANTIIYSIKKKLELSINS